MNFTLNIFILSLIVTNKPKLGGGGHSKIKLINNFELQMHSKNWINDICNNNEYFIEFMYNDIIKEIDKSVLLCDKFTYYIGYYNNIYHLSRIEEPIYISRLKLDPLYKKFNINSIIQNPNYHEYSKLYYFILELIYLCDSCNISLNIDNLKNYSNSRYWLSINNFYFNGNELL